LSTAAFGLQWVDAVEKVAISDLAGSCPRPDSASASPKMTGRAEVIARWSNRPLRKLHTSLESRRTKCITGHGNFDAADADGDERAGLEQLAVDGAAGGIGLRLRRVGASFRLGHRLSKKTTGAAGCACIL
jgi:hypothetical protein